MKSLLLAVCLVPILRIDGATFDVNSTADLHDAALVQTAL